MERNCLGDRIWYQSWPQEVPKCLSYPDCTLAGFLKNTARQYPDRPAIYFLGAKVSYRELWEMVRRFATSLAALGLEKGDVCALMLPNSIQFVVAYYACQLIGVTVTAINPTYKSLEIRHHLKDSNAKALVVLDTVYHEARKGAEDTAVERIIGTNVVDLCGFSVLKRWAGKLLKKIPSAGLPADVLSMKKLLDVAPDPPEVDVNPEDIAVLQYSGGTTGLPKGAMLTHRNVVANAVMCDAWLWKKEKRMGAVGVLPLFHSFAMTAVMNTAIRTGSFQILFPRPPADLTKLFAVIEKYSADSGLILPGVAVLFNKINNHPKVGAYNLKGLKMAVSGAGPLPLEIQQRFERITGAVIIEGYGLTEATPVTHVNPVFGRRKTGTIGLPMPDTDIRIMDKETGTREIPPLPFAVAETGGLTEEQAEEANHYTGELVIKGPQVMKGYLNRPEETKAALRDGWLYTGDIACIDSQGYTIIRDRLKDMIKFKGYAIFPAEVEDMLHKHPDIKAAAVIGVPHEKVGEIVKAFIVLDPEKEGHVSEEDIKSWAAANMTHYKVPSEIEFRKELRTTMVGKVLRRVLKEEPAITRK